MKLRSILQNRREFLASCAVAAGLAPFGTWIVQRANASGAVATIKVRYEASSTQGKKNLEVYRKAVSRMQGLTAADAKKYPMHHPFSWRFQANIHAYPTLQVTGQQEPLGDIFKAGGDFSTIQVAANRKLALGSEVGGASGDDRLWYTCTHHDPALHFLPWHRLYLAYFEAIVEKVAGVPFALPYWNYLNPDKRKMPTMFASPTTDGTAGGPANALYFAARTSEFVRDGLKEDVLTSLRSARIQRLLNKHSLFSTPRTLGFNQELEGFDPQTAAGWDGLHDTLHGAIGTRNGMGNPETAARDPLFWLHHCSIDRIWESWRNPGRDRKRAPGDGTSRRDPNTPSSWYEAKYAFIDTNMVRMEREVAFALRLVDNLHYRYDELEPVNPMPIGIAGEMASEKAPTDLQSSETSTQTIKKAGDSATLSLAPSAKKSVALGFAADQNARYDLAIDIRSKRSPGIYRTFVVTPKQPGSAETVETLVGSFNLFTLGAHAHHGAGAPNEEADHTLRFDITDLVRNKVIDPANATNLKIVVRTSYLDDEINLAIKKARIIGK